MALTYRPELSRLVWRLHLAGVFRKLYYWLNRPSGGKSRIEIEGLSVDFYVRTPWELRALDPIGGFGKERHVLELLATYLDRGDVVYDVGSNFGIYTLLVAKAVGPEGLVIAIEPETQGYAHLQDNIKLNGLTNIRSFQVALGDQGGVEKLSLAHTGASRLATPATTADHPFEEVQVIRGDRLVESEGLPIPRVVKIDVEGFEWQVIRGLEHTLAQPDCKLLCCEIHPQLLPPDTKPDHILDFLKSLGFNKIDTFQRGTAEFHALAHK